MGKTFKKVRTKEKNSKKSKSSNDFYEEELETFDRKNLNKLIKKR